MSNLLVHSIFESISGEAGIFPQGTWTTFIRLQGCNLRCNYCDTKKTQTKKGGKNLTVKQIVKSIKTPHVLITGGEPLHQNISNLLCALHKEGHITQVETNGTLPPPNMASLAGWVVDYKTPSSGMTKHNFSISNFASKWNKYSVSVKFVLDFKEESDIQFTLKSITELDTWFYPKIKFLISPLDANPDQIGKVVEQIKQVNPDLLTNVIFSIQLHKLIGLP